MHTYSEILLIFFPRNFEYSLETYQFSKLSPGGGIEGMLVMEVEG